MRPQRPAVLDRSNHTPQNSTFCDKRNTLSFHESIKTPIKLQNNQKSLSKFIEENEENNFSFT